MSERIYVCEWVKKELSLFENNEEFCLLTSYDYTYHESLEQAQEISNYYWKGYSLAKGITSSLSEEIIEKPLHKKVHCECIWVYENYSAIGRYVLQSNKWIFDAYCEAWHQNWEDMLSMPVPIIEF